MQKGVDFTGISVITICHDGNARYLLEYRSNKCRDEHFTWSPVGSGGLKRGERLEDAVKREVKEECGAEAFDIECIGYREVFRQHDSKETHWIAFDFRAKVDPKSVAIQEPDMCLKLEWCRVTEIPEPQHSTFPAFLKKYRDIL